MNSSSLDEFQMLESMLQKSEDSLIKHQRKKPKMDSNNSKSGQNNAAVSNCDGDLERILNEINKQSSGERDELIKKLSARLHTELQDKEEMKKSENLIAEELEDIKHQVKQFSSLVHKYKDSVNANNKAVKSSECQTDLLSLNNNNRDHLAESLEICRRQVPPLHSTIMLDDDGLSSAKLASKTTHTLTNGNSHIAPHEDHPQEDFKKSLIEQMKIYQDKFQTERQFYIEENERLNRIIEENARMMDEMKCQLKSSTSAYISTSTSKSTNSFLEDSKDYSRVQGLFDWPIEENSVRDQVLANEATGCFDQANSYNVTNNSRMLHVLSDLVKTFLDTENDIQKQLETLGLENNVKNKSGRADDNNTHLLGFPSLDDERISELTFELSEDGPDLTPCSMVYSSTSMNGTTNDIEDDVVLGASRRLRFAVERVLKILTEVVEHHAQHDFKDLLKQKEDAEAELHEEVQRREVVTDQLTRQLLEKENLVHELEGEKRVLLAQTLDYNEVKSEHERLKTKLEEYERDQDRFITDHKRFELEKSSFTQGLPQLQQKLVHETETLNRDVHQLQQDKANLMKKVNNLTSDIETLKSEKNQIIENKNAEFEELLSQMESKDKNLSSLKRFMDEQTQERELEREEYNKEIGGLKDKLKEKDKGEGKLKSTIRALESQITLLSEDKTMRDEQMEEMSQNLKESNLKVSELHLTVRNLESDIERNNQVELELRNKLKELTNTLDIKTNDEANWEDLISAITKITETKTATNAQPEANKSNKTVALDKSDSYSSDTTDNSVFLTIKQMDDKIHLLNDQVTQLLEANEKLKGELTLANEFALKFDQIKTQMQSLESNLTETQKENEMLRQEINENHMKYSELKVKLDSSVDVNEFKKVVTDLQGKLQAEKKQTESVTVKLEQANRHVHELDEKLDAYKKEIKTYKELIKSHEHDSKQAKDKTDYKHKYESILNEVVQLSGKVTSKEKTIAILEQNMEMLKAKITSINKEKELYYEKLQSIDESQNMIVIYEQNLDKLQLQNKMSMDKINYLDLEIKSLKKKIEILEKENEFLKIENQKLQKLRQEMSAAVAMSDSTEDIVDSMSHVGSLGSHHSNGNLYLNGLDKMNSVSSNNLLMLKVRRLLSQKGALIYQKNYLIHLLGGFQMTENATLALLSNLNHTKDLDDFETKMRGKQKFRSVAYALIALNRMRFMVNIWQCRKRQLLLSKTAHSISSNLQNVPLPPKKVTSSSSSHKLSSSSSSSSSTSPIHFTKHTSLPGQISSTMKDYVDRLHVVHGALGLHTNKI